VHCNGFRDKHSTLTAGVEIQSWWCVCEV